MTKKCNSCGRRPRTRWIESVQERLSETFRSGLCPKCYRRAHPMERRVRKYGRVFAFPSGINEDIARATALGIVSPMVPEVTAKGYMVIEGPEIFQRHDELKTWTESCYGLKARVLAIYVGKKRVHDSKLEGWLKSDWAARHSMMIEVPRAVELK